MEILTISTASSRRGGFFRVFPPTGGYPGRQRDHHIQGKEMLMPEPVVIATWPFGRTAVKTALPLLQAGRPPLDAAIAGAQAVEDDPTVHSVGFGGLGNAIGTVQLDACVMDGSTLACGAVAGVENVRHVAALARRVMEKTPHILLVGDGARTFAVQNGFPLETLTTPESVAEWLKVKPKPRKEPPDSHDTVTVLCLDKKGSLGGVCSTSGLAHKLPGRVGDSPLIAHGLYVDNTAGAAGATGVGEEVIRIGGSLLIVEAMRAGKSPQEACEAVVRRLNAVAVRRGVHPARVAFFALDRTGRVGAACTRETNFDYAVGRPGGIELLKAKELGPEE
jgi:isoaspartyl peptidase/L-asparaginase-like protein (Ntn-hydrolase superfamily)